MKQNKKKDQKDNSIIPFTVPGEELLEDSFEDMEEEEDFEDMEEDFEDMEEDSEDEDFPEEDEEYEEEDDEEEPGVSPILKAGIGVGLVVLAVLICAILWIITHKDGSGNPPANSKETLTGESGMQETMTGSMQEPEETGAGLQTEPADGESGAGGEILTEPGLIRETDPAENAEKNGAVTEAEASDKPEAPQEPENVQEPISGNASMEFTEMNDTVTAKDVTNLRSLPSTQDSENVIEQLTNGQTVQRTGINDTTGWSRLEYNGSTVYAVTRFLTTDLTYKTPETQANPNRINTQEGRIIIFTDCDDNVTPKEYVNLRVEPSTSQGDTTVKCQVKNGTAIHRTGYSSDSGWSRVEYEGQVLYVVSSMIYTVEGGQEQN